MPLINGLLNLFFLSGNIVLKGLGISVEEDSGVIRSFINSSVWGAVTLAIALQYLV